MPYWDQSPFDDLYIFKAFSPYYAIELLTTYPKGFWILGAVFLCTTGAEALYSDLGHCGRGNIRISWIFVKTCLILNYLGQGAWLLANYNGTSISDIDQRAASFIGIMPQWFVIPGIIIATAAAIIASQALISGSFTLISESYAPEPLAKIENQLSNRRKRTIIYSRH